MPFQFVPTSLAAVIVMGLSLLVELLPTAQAETDGAVLGEASASVDIATVAKWMMNLQYTNRALPSYGALKVHHTAGHTAPDGAKYFRVVPYQVNLGVRGLLRTSVADRHQTARRWMNWYLQHLNLKGTPPGLVYDHWYLADGTGETTCPPGIAPALCDFDDASDSAAATFLGMAWEYCEIGGDTDFFQAAGHKAKLETIADVMLALQQEDGLAWAKNSYRAKYVMDNSEVYWGLHAMSRLESAVFGDGRAAKKYEAAAQRVRDGIHKSLLDAKSGLYHVAKHENGAVDAARLDVWYPDATAQVWPLLFGVVDAASAPAKVTMASINHIWDGDPQPDWSARPVDAAGFTWTSIAYASVLVGNKARARAHTAFVKALKFPQTPDEAGFATSFTIIDGGWLLLTLSVLNTPEPREAGHTTVRKTSR